MAKAGGVVGVAWEGGDLVDVLIYLPTLLCSVTEPSREHIATCSTSAHSGLQSGLQSTLSPSPSPPLQHRPSPFPPSSTACSRIHPHFLQLSSDLARRRHGLSDHDIEFLRHLVTQETDLLLDDEPEPRVDDQVDRIAALKVTSATFGVGLFHSPAPTLASGCCNEPLPRSEVRTYLVRAVMDRLGCVALAARARLGSNVHQIPGVVLAGTQDVVFGGVQDGEEFGEEAGAAFGGELVVQAPHAAAQVGAPVVHVFARGHPGSMGADIQRLVWGGNGLRGFSMGI